MQQRRFGKNGLVSVFGVGCGRIGSLNNPVPTREIVATLERAIEAGVNLFDTANIYGQGDSERTLSRLLHKHRDRMFVVTKVGGRFKHRTGILRHTKPFLRYLLRMRPQLNKTLRQARAVAVEQDFRPAELQLAVDGCLHRLGLDRLDGLLLHDPPLDVVRDPEVHDFLGELLSTNKAAHVGISTDNLESIEAAISIPGISILQIPISTAKSLSDTPTLETIRNNRIGLFVRGAIPTSGNVKVGEAIAAAAMLDQVTSVIAGVSTRRHLDEIISAIP